MSLNTGLIQKHQFVVDTSNKQLKTEFKNHNIYNSLQNIKDPGINFIKDVNDLYTEIKPK